MELNGWQRLGIVAFVAWAFIGCGFFWVTIHENDDVAYKLCESNFSRMLNDDVPDRWEQQEKCIKDASVNLHSHWEKNTQFFLRYVALFVSVPALFVWGLASLCIVTVRWIRKGFA